LQEDDDVKEMGESMGEFVLTQALIEKYCFLHKQTYPEVGFHPSSMVGWLEIPEEHELFQKVLQLVQTRGQVT
jgi:hypothetical protein